MEQDLNGKWTGKLTYGETFGHLEHEVLFFTLEIEQKGDEFAGTSRDVDGIGISPHETSVTGFWYNQQINFVRKYRVPVLLDQGGWKEVVQENPGTEASFSGVYNAATGEFEGDWIILSGFLVYDHLFFENENGGSWSMKRDTDM